MSTFRGLFIRRDSTRGTTPVEARQALAGLLTPSGDLGVLPGVLSGLGVTGIATTWAYSVAAGHAVTSRTATDGAVLLGVSGPTNTPTVAVAPATGSRWDLIWVRHNDVDSGDANSEAVLGVTSGTASGTPSKPYGSVPVGALVLAEAQVSAGATGTLHANVVITNVPARVASRGGIIPVSGVAQRDRLNTAVSATNPIVVDRLDTGKLERNAGSGWVQVTSGQWVDITRMAYSTTVNTTWTNVTNPTPILVPAGKSLEVEFHAPAVQVPAGGGCSVELIVGSIMYGARFSIGAGVGIHLPLSMSDSVVGAGANVTTWVRAAAHVGTVTIGSDAFNSAPVIFRYRIA